MEFVHLPPGDYHADRVVAGKIKGKIKKEVIKRTVLSAYFAAVKLPMMVYGMGSMALDNSWMQATDRAKKAGRILGEVLEKKVQGERPVILVRPAPTSLLHKTQACRSARPPAL